MLSFRNLTMALASRGIWVIVPAVMGDVAIWGPRLTWASEGQQGHEYKRKYSVSFVDERGINRTIDVFTSIGSVTTEDERW